jgi:hypothetical protein
MITVVHTKRNPDAGKPWSVYIGRPSPLGNTYSVEKFGRERCIDLFRKDLQAALLPEDLAYRSEYLSKIKVEFYHLVEIYKQYGKLVLACWCFPKKCHGDAIKEEILRGI